MLFCSGCLKINRRDTVGGVLHTRYPRTNDSEDGQNAGNYVPPLFSEKTKNNLINPETTFDKHFVVTIDKMNKTQTFFMEFRQ